MATGITISHPLSRTSFFLFLDRGGEKEALPESRQAFEIAVARTSGVVNLIFLRTIITSIRLLMSQ